MTEGKWGASWLQVTRYLLQYIHNIPWGNKIYKYKFTNDQAKLALVGVIFLLNVGAALGLTEKVDFCCGSSDSSSDEEEDGSEEEEDGLPESQDAVDSVVKSRSRKAGLTLSGTSRLEARS